MGGFGGLVDPQDQGQGAASPQQQQPTPQSSQPPQQAQQGPSQGGQQPDQIEALKQSLAQQAQPKAQPSGGPVRSMLQNFFSGMGQSMMHEAGLPTEYEKQQKALANYTSLKSAEGLAEMHKAVASQYGNVQFPIPDGKGGMTTIGVEAKGVPMLLSRMMQGQTQENVAATKATSAANVAAINQGGGLQLPVDANTAQLAGEPSLAGTKLGKGGWAMLNSALQAKGYHVQDMGKDGADGGMWVVDKGGNKVNQVSPNSVMVARGQSFAQAKAENTPFETVEPGTNIPTTISAAQALRTGAPKVPLGTQQKLGGQYALYKDAYGILDNIDRLTDTVNLDDPAVRGRVTAGYAALKDPASKGLTGEILSNFLARQPINDTLQPDEREFILNMAQGKAAATGLRSILGQAGSNEMQQRLDSGLFPGGQSVGSKASVKQQTAATRALLGRFSVGQPQVGLNAPGSSTSLQNQSPSAPTVRFTEGADTYNIPAEKVERFKQLHPQAVPSGR